jgi:ComF family protein
VYDHPLKDLVHALKYSREKAAALVLADTLFDALRSWEAVEFAQAVVPVPLHPSRQETRTFNQAALMGRVLARRLQLPFLQPLRRTRRTETQTELSHSARIENVKGAFAVSRPQAVAGRQVLLVDDVMTTGATMSECARALLRAGAVRVYAAAAAR